MSYILRCDAPACPSKSTMWGGLPAGWTQTHNRSGDVVHACATAGHLVAAQATGGAGTLRLALAGIV